MMTYINFEGCVNAKIQTIPNDNAVQHRNRKPTRILVPVTQQVYNINVHWRYYMESVMRHIRSQVIIHHLNFKMGKICLLCSLIKRRLHYVCDINEIRWHSSPKENTNATKIA